MRTEDGATTYTGRSHSIDHVSPGPGPLLLSYGGAAGWNMDGTLALPGISGSQVLRVDHAGCAEFQSVAEAVAYAAANEPPSTDDEIPWQGKDGWWIVPAPGVYPEPPFTVPAFARVVGAHGGSGWQGAGGDVTLFFGTNVHPASSGPMITLGQNSGLGNLSIAYSGGVTGSLTGPVDIIRVDSATATTNNELVNVRCEVGVVGLGNDAHPVVLVNHVTAGDPVVLNVVDCRLVLQYVGILSNAGSRLLLTNGARNSNEPSAANLVDSRLNAIGFGGEKDCLEFVDTDFLLDRCDVLGGDIRTSTASVGLVSRLRYNAGVFVLDTSTVTDQRFNPPATAGADPGVEGEIRFTASSVQRYRSGVWHEAALAFAPML